MSEQTTPSTSPQSSLIKLTPIRAFANLDLDGNQTKADFYMPWSVIKLAEPVATLQTVALMESMLKPLKRSWSQTALVLPAQ